MADNFLIQLDEGEPFQPHPLLLECSPVLQAACSEPWTIADEPRRPFSLPCNRKVYDEVVSHLVAQHYSKAKLMAFLCIEAVEPPQGKRCFMHVDSYPVLTSTSSLQVNTLLVIYDKAGTWRLGSVKEIVSGTALKIHYTGWDNRYDEVLDVSLNRIRLYVE